MKHWSCAWWYYLLCIYFKGKKLEINEDSGELVIQPEDVLPYGNAFRSPFDPRSEEDLISDAHGGSEEQHTPASGKFHRWLEGDTSVSDALLFDRAGPTSSSERTGGRYRDQNGMQKFYKL